VPDRQGAWFGHPLHEVRIADAAASLRRVQSDVREGRVNFNDSINHGFRVSIGSGELVKCRPVNWRDDGSLEYQLADDDTVRIAKPGRWARMDEDGQPNFSPKRRDRVAA
jgi:hypothetical protein